ncbi:PLP-dependent cysteine synthase family protein [Chloroflexota bacterium]
MYFKDAVEAIGHTPLVELSQLTPNRKVRILAKLEGMNTGGSASIKDRVARYMLLKAEQDGQLTRDRSIIEATSGNTGLSLACLGHKLGYRVTIVMPDNTSREKQRLFKIYNAELVLTDARHGAKGAIDKAGELLARDNSCFMPGQYANPANPQAHYETTAVEIINDFPYDRVDAFIAGIGTGGTIVGISRRLREKYPAITVVGLQPPPEDFIPGLLSTGEGYTPPILDTSVIDEMTLVTSRQAKVATGHLLDKEGIFAGLSAGAAVHQAVRVAREMDAGNIVTVLPDGGWKYLSQHYWPRSR